MVGANGANTNAEIHAPLSSPSAGPKIEIRCTLPQPREAGCVARWPWTSRGRAGPRRGGQARAALHARLVRGSLDEAATLRTRTAREPTD